MFRAADRVRGRCFFWQCAFFGGKSLSDDHIGDALIKIFAVYRWHCVGFNIGIECLDRYFVQLGVCLFVILVKRDFVELLFETVIVETLFIAGIETDTGRFKFIVKIIFQSIEIADPGIVKYPGFDYIVERGNDLVIMFTHGYT